MIKPQSTTFDNISIYPVLRAKAFLRRWLYRRELRRLRRFKNRHAPIDRCFLVGNGPSLRTQDVLLMKTDVVFVTNNFAMHEDCAELKPAYYCVSDHKYWCGGEVNAEWYDVIHNHASSSRKFFPIGFRSLVRRRELFSQDDTYYLNYTYLPVWETGEFSVDVERGVHQGDSVIIDFCLPLAFYMGFRVVYLVGCDTGYGVETDSEGEAGHFYDAAEETVQSSVSHSYMRNTWPGRVMRSYEVCKRIFQEDGRRIYNATAGGVLEVFPRVEYESLF